MNPDPITYIVALLTVPACLLIVCTVLGHKFRQWREKRRKERARRDGRVYLEKL